MPPPNARSGPPDITPEGRPTRNHADSPTLARAIKSRPSITGGHDPGTVRDAVAAARRGWHVFPVCPDGKRPACDRWEQRATCDPEAVARYWPGPRHNIGVAMGPSGLVGIDVDPPDGHSQLARLQERHGGLPATFTVRTPRGGEHLYFLALGGREIRNSAGKIAPHIDCRGAGGFLVAPGSIIGGRRYEAALDVDVAQLPPWLADLADPPRPAAAPPSSAAMPVQGHGYAAAALRGEAALARDAAPGTRNHQLNRSAFLLGTLAGAGILDEAEIVTTLLQAAAGCGLLADDGQRACERTIASGLTAGMANPRQGVAA